MRRSFIVVIGSIPLIGPFAREVCRLLLNFLFPGSQKYWEGRYARGKDSGNGSRGELREYKASVINAFVRTNNILSVIELGCGDGGQLALAEYPRYIGLDVSPTAIDLCKGNFTLDNTKRFYYIEDPLCVDLLADIIEWRSDLALSLDVIFHLISDDVYQSYLRGLFDLAIRYVIIYSSNVDEKQFYQTRKREFTRWVSRNAADWQLAEKIVNPYSSVTNSSFYIYQKVKL